MGDPLDPELTIIKNRLIGSKLHDQSCLPSLALSNSLLVNKVSNSALLTLPYCFQTLPNVGRRQSVLTSAFCCAIASEFGSWLLYSQQITNTHTICACFQIFSYYILKIIMKLNTAYYQKSLKTL